MVDLDGGDGDLTVTADMRAFRWTDPAQCGVGMVDLTQAAADAGLDLQGHTLLAATGISSDGQFIAGIAAPQNGETLETVGFVLQICDECIDGECLQFTSGTVRSAPAASRWSIAVLSLLLFAYGVRVVRRLR